MIRELKAAIGYGRKSLKTLAANSMKRPVKVEYIVYEITDECNSRCKHCNIWKMQPGGDSLTSKEIERVFGSGCFKDVRELIVTGGEPVLRPDIEENLLAVQKHIRPDALVSFSTNGLLPERVLGTVERCLESGMNMVVGVSLDGIGKHHDTVRGVKGNFEKVDYLLKKLLELRKKRGNLSVTVGYTLAPWTFENLEEVRIYAKSCGMNFLPQMYEEFAYYGNTDRKKGVYTGEMFDAVKAFPESFQKEVILKGMRNESLRYRCASMRNFFLMRCNGDVSPCLKFGDIRVGNLREEPFHEIWNGPRAKDARELVDKCAGCSNTWATGWSMRYWVPPFVKTLSKTVIKKHIARVRTPGKSL